MSRSSASTIPKASAVRFRAALWRAIHRNRSAAEDARVRARAAYYLTRFLAIVLVSIASEVPAGPAEEPDLPLPPPPTSPAQEGVVVIISRSQILVGDDPTPIVPLPSRERLVEAGVDAKYKRSGPNDLYIVPLGSALERARDAGEAIVIADATTPYRLLVEVLFTLGHSGLGKYHLMVLGRKK